MPGIISPHWQYISHKKIWCQLWVTWDSILANISEMPSLILTTCLWFCRKKHIHWSVFPVTPRHFVQSFKCGWKAQEYKGSGVFWFNGHKILDFNSVSVPLPDVYAEWSTLYTLSLCKGSANWTKYTQKRFCNITVVLVVV